MGKHLRQLAMPSTFTAAPQRESAHQEERVSTDSPSPRILVGPRRVNNRMCRVVYVGVESDPEGRPGATGRRIAGPLNTA